MSGEVGLGSELERVELGVLWWRREVPEVEEEEGEQEEEGGEEGEGNLDVRDGSLGPGGGDGGSWYALR